MYRLIVTNLGLALLIFLFIGCDGNSGLTSNKTNNDSNTTACTTNSDCVQGDCVNGACKSPNIGDLPDVDDNGHNCSQLSECGNCDQSCKVGSIGGANGEGFDLDDADGVVLDDNGSITLDSRRQETHFIWLANTGQGTLSKVDTRTYEEVARYWSGPAAGGNDPSRTSVNTLGDVYVGNRHGMSVTKIATGPECGDTNGDGVVTTSSGAGDVLAWGQDDCILWSTSLADGGGIIRAVAAQDSADGDTSVVWVGGWNGVIWKLDGQTGEVLVRTSSPIAPYGFALDKDQNLWIATYPHAQIARLDTTRCLDNDSCNVEVCGDDGDHCVKQLIGAPAGGYGITVDFKQRVWMGGSVMRYDPVAPHGSRWVHVSPGTFIHGIAADEEGWIYGAGFGQGMYRFEADNPTNFTIVQGTQGHSVKGVAVDLDGKAWGINLSHNNAFVVEPGAGLNDGAVVQTVAGLVSPYTYSDMTGSQLRFATNQRGTYTRRFEGCAPEHHLWTEWHELRFDAEATGSARLVLRVRGATTAERLTEAPWIEIGELPGLSSPVDMLSLLEAHHLERSQFLEVQAQLFAFRDRDSLSVPILRSIELQYECPFLIN